MYVRTYLEWASRHVGSNTNNVSNVSLEENKTTKPWPFSGPPLEIMIYILQVGRNELAARVGLILTDAGSTYVE